MRIDLNADLGEGADDEALLPWITSANIACGVHAGNEKTMRQTARLAAIHHVGIGAHPGLDDRGGFGRREMKLEPQQAYELVRTQVRHLLAIAQQERLELQHVKPHGALYLMASRDLDLARAIVRAVCDVNSGLRVFGMSGSRLLEAARDAGLPVAEEFFADRAYRADGTLVPRSVTGALIADPHAAADRTVRAVCHGKVKSIADADLTVRADTVCIHGDATGAALLAKVLHSKLAHAEIEIRRIGLP